MKNLIIVASLLFSSNVFAKPPQDVTCVDRNLQDATLVASFIEVGDSDARVKLLIPTDENSVKTYTGDCTQDTGSLEFAQTCSVQGPDDVGFVVRLFSMGGSDLFASVTPLTMAGPMPATNLPCDKN